MELLNIEMASNDIETLTYVKVEEFQYLGVLLTAETGTETEKSRFWNLKTKKIQKPEPESEPLNQTNYGTGTGTLFLIGLIWIPHVDF